jgi:hypothetical protein
VIIACPAPWAWPFRPLSWSAVAAADQIGVLIKGPERTRVHQVVDIIVLDKTGTITTGQMKLVDVVTADGVEVAERVQVPRRTRGRLCGDQRPLALNPKPLPAGTGPRRVEVGNTQPGWAGRREP